MEPRRLAVGRGHWYVVHLSTLPQMVYFSLDVDANVILMTSTFDVLSEVPIESNEFGEGKIGFQSYQVSNYDTVIQMPL